MRNYQALGQSLSITNREFDLFQGVSRGGVLTVERGDGGPFDVKVTSFSRRGFDRSPNREDLVALLRKGAFSIAPVGARLQVALTPVGKAVAELIGCYSLSAMVHGVTPPAAEDLEPEPEEAPKTGSEYEPFTLDDEGDQVSGEEEATAAPTTLPPETRHPEGHPDRDESEPAQPEDLVHAGDVEPDADPVDDPNVQVALPAAGAGFKELQAFADSHGINHDGLRSKAKVRAAIEAHFQA